MMCLLIIHKGPTLIRVWVLNLTECQDCKICLSQQYNGGLIDTGRLFWSFLNGLDKKS